MRISFLEYEIKVESWGSKSDLGAYLEGAKDSLILGESRNQERHFFSMTVRVNEWARDSQAFLVGVCSEGLGLAPQLMFLPEREQILLGVNSEVYTVRLRQREAQLTISLEGLFVSMMRRHDPDGVLVFHEIGAVMLNLEGSPIWKFSRDVVVGARLEKEKLYLDFMDSPTVTLDIRTGE